MTPIREFSTRRIQQPSQRRSLTPAVAGAVAAFAVGALDVLCWHYLPAPRQWTLIPAIDSSSTAPDFSGDRVGRATTAPFLKVCLTKDVLDIRHDVNIEPGTLLQILEASSSQSRLTKVLGAPKQHAVLELAQMWGQVADCIYRQNSWQLCDIDNRALAVDAGNAFLRQADRIISQPETTYAAEPGEIPALALTTDRVLDALRTRVRTGVLISSDFGPFVPSAIRHLLGETKSVQNDCAKKP
jgi:hypothetical protein